MVLVPGLLGGGAGHADHRIVSSCGGRPGHEAGVVWSSAFRSIEWGLPGVCPTVHGLVTTHRGSIPELK